MLGTCLLIPSLSSRLLSAFIPLGFNTCVWQAHKQSIRTILWCQWFVTLFLLLSLLMKISPSPNIAQTALQLCPRGVSIFIFQILWHFWVPRINSQAQKNLSALPSQTVEAHGYVCFKGRRWSDPFYNVPWCTDGVTSIESNFFNLFKKLRKMFLLFLIL